MSDNLSDRALADPCRICPGLTASATGILWRNSLGQEFDLSTELKHTPGEVAIQMRRSTEWVLRKIRSKQMYPVIYHNPRFVEVYHCAISDYYHRHTRGVTAPATIAQATAGNDVA